MWPAQCHSDCYENSTQPPHIVIPAKAGIQSQRRGSQSTLKHWASPIFIPLCGLHRATVIPNVVRNLKSMPATRRPPILRLHLDQRLKDALRRRNQQSRKKDVRTQEQASARLHNVTWLAYYEETPSIESAIAREKQIKAWRRSKKVALVESANPKWKDLSLEWQIDFGHGP